MLRHYQKTGGGISAKNGKEQRKDDKSMVKSLVQYFLQVD